MSDVSQVMECPRCGNGHWVVGKIDRTLILSCSRCRWSTATGTERPWTMEEEMVFVDRFDDDGSPVGERWMASEEDALKYYYKEAIGKN